MHDAPSGTAAGPRAADTSAPATRVDDRTKASVPSRRGGRQWRTAAASVGRRSSTRAREPDPPRNESAGTGSIGCYAAPAVERVLVLNASYEPLNVCSLRRAHVLVWKGKAEILESHDKPLRSACTSFRRPHVIRLVTYVRVPRGVTRRISRRVLFARDGWACMYCGSGGNRLTLDHVVPRSRGGTSVWENVVTSCAPCNHRKGDRLLEETGMILRKHPRPPTPVLFIRLTAEHIPDTWRRYLPGLEAAAAAAA
jgi:5-methylcytosine-specific restriction endonuclease McrA